MRALTLIALLLASQPILAASLESLVMPGPVIEGHAELEEQCSNCHAPFSQTTQTNLCLDCHETIAEDLRTGQGFHGTGGRLLDSACRDCHTEHKGREADIVGLVAESFDHGLTGFPLDGRHAQLSCQDCHQTTGSFREAAQDCAGCHKPDDVHGGNLGADCAGCHEPADWQRARFDHQQETGFALDGGHADLNCGACHAGQIFDRATPSCVGCHALDDPHQGQRGSECESCHAQDNWKVEYDHLTRTGFALEGAHQQLGCNQCHLSSLTDELPADCGGCHGADDPHAGELSQCRNCHGPDQWDAGIRFDHEFTDFPLLGMHRLATCAQCHLSLKFHEASKRCADCHQNDDVHRQSLGSACEDCHTSAGWAFWEFDHGARTEFPLTGAHKDLVCAACHEPGAERSLAIATACVSCHQSADVHRGAFGNRCDRCHTTGSFTDDTEFR